MLYRDFNKHYEQLVKIGEGSYGKVYLCYKKTFFKIIKKFYTFGFI